MRPYNSQRSNVTTNTTLILSSRDVNYPIENQQGKKIATKRQREQIILQNNNNAYFNSLESLRGIAALLVVIYHVNWQNPVFNFGIIRNGALMVDLFFVLSGFVILHSYGDKIGRSTSITRFMFLRFARLYPLHFALLLVFLVIELLKYIAATSFGIASNSPPFERNNFAAFIYNLFLVQSMGLLDHETFNRPSWSISTEFYTYLIFACLLLFFTSKPSRWIVFPTIALGSLIVITSLGHHSLTFTGTYSVFRCTFGFFIGTIAYLIFEKLNEAKLSEFKSKYAPALTYLSAVLLLTLLWTKRDNWVEFLVPFVVAALVLFLALSPTCILSNMLLHPFLRWLGKISYSIYMIHMAVLWGVSQTLNVVFSFPATAEGNDVVFQTSQLQGACLLLAVLALVLAMSHFTFCLIEEPFRKKAKSWVNRTQRTDQASFG